MGSKKDARKISGNGVFAFIFGLVLLVVGCWIAREFYTIWHTWPTADATVIGGEVEESVHYPTARGGIGTPQFKPRIEFRYTLNQQPYITRAWLNAEDTREKAQKRLLAAYPPGSHHVIRYNPDDPTDIRFGTPDVSMLVFSVVLLASGLVLSAIGAGALASSRRAGISGAPGWDQGTKASGQVSGFRTPPVPGSNVVATICCPSCGRQVEANLDTCPNCLKSLRAA